jgi:galactose mutarotase-like enzyme
VIELRNGASVATIDAERGGRLASLAVEGRDLIVGPPDDADRTILWGSFVMAPWCGRIEGGVLEWDGRTHQLPVTLEGNAIHGVLWDRPWAVEAADGQHSRHLGAL